MSALNVQVGGDHYKNLAIQPIEYCQKNNLGACESFVIKYVTRHKSKNGVQDIKKAIHMLELLVELEYGDKLMGYEVKFHINGAGGDIEVYHQYFHHRENAEKLCRSFKHPFYWLNDFKYLVSLGESYKWQDKIK